MWHFLPTLATPKTVKMFLIDNKYSYANEGKKNTNNMSLSLAHAKYTKTFSCWKKNGKKLSSKFKLVNKIGKLNYIAEERK